MSRWLTEEVNPWRQTWGPDKGHYSLDEIIYWTHQMWLQGLIKVQKKGKYRIIGVGDSSISLAADRGPSSGRGFPTYYNIHFDSIYTDVNIQGILVSRMFFEPFVSLKKRSKESRNIHFKCNWKQEEKEKILSHPTRLHRAYTLKAHAEQAALCFVGDLVREMYDITSPHPDPAVWWPSSLRPTVFYFNSFVYLGLIYKAHRYVCKSIFTSHFISSF